MVFIPNNQNINRTLTGKTGLVYPHVKLFVDGVVHFAKFYAPEDTHRMKNGIKAKLTGVIPGQSIKWEVGTDPIDGRGRRYARIVHQGRDAIYPDPELKFRWKQRGNGFFRVPTENWPFINPRAGRPFLFEGMESAQGFVRNGEFRIEHFEKPRTTGS